MIHFKTFTNLPEESKMIRIKVFMEEQGFKNEFDDIDNRLVVYFGMQRCKRILLDV